MDGSRCALGRPPPPKPQRQGKVNGRSGSVDSKRRSYAANGHAPVDVNDLKLREAKAEVDHEVCFRLLAVCKIISMKPERYAFLEKGIEI